MPGHSDMKRKKRKRKDLTKFVINHIAAVDRGAQAAIGRVLLKRDTVEDYINDGLADDAIIKLLANTFSKVLMKPRNGESREAFVSRFMGDAAMRREFPEQEQRAAVANRQFRAAMRKDDGNAIGPEGDALADPSDTATDPASNRADQIGEETGMTKEGQGAATDEAAEQVKTLTSERDDAVAKADRFEKIVGLPPDQRAHFDSLDKADQDAFLGFSAEQRTGELAKAADANPVIYTSKTTGTEFRKSDSPQVIELAKQNDALADRLAKSENDRAQTLLEKRAASELEHWKGTNLAKAELLRAVDGIANEELRKEVGEMLKAQTLGFAELTKTRGTSAVPSDGGSAFERFNELAKSYAEKHSVSMEAASVAVLDTPEGQQLYNESVDPDMARNGG